jgi:coenzyme F420-0:L-glutamate ligase / coenzyme F420-1:gamma-L-glutamate ligase
VPAAEPVLDPPGALRILPVNGLGEIRTGDDLASLVVAALAPARPGAPALNAGDVVVVTQKIVSKAEGRLVAIVPDDPAAKAALIESESRRVLRRRGDLLITETRHGFICANAGVDLSNVDAGMAALLPVDPDRSARRLRADLGRALGVEVGVIISDTFGRPWRRGVTDVAIGCAGVAAVIDLRGNLDATGRELLVTEVCLADELASAAELVMGKDRSVPVAIVRGVPEDWLRPGSVVGEIVRTSAEDLFR